MLRKSAEESNGGGGALIPVSNRIGPVPANLDRKSDCIKRHDGTTSSASPSIAINRAYESSPYPFSIFNHSLKRELVVEV